MRRVWTCGRWRVGADGWIASTVLNEATIALVRANFLEPTHPELHILLSEQQQRRFAVCRRALCIRYVH